MTNEEIKAISKEDRLKQFLSANIKALYGCSKGAREQYANSDMQITLPHALMLTANIIDSIDISIRLSSFCDEYHYRYNDMVGLMARIIWEYPEMNAETLKVLNLMPYNK